MIKRSRKDQKEPIERTASQGGTSSKLNMNSKEEAVNKEGDNG